MNNIPDIYINPIHFYETECKSVAEHCSATISAEYNGFTVRHEAFDDVKHFKNVDTLYSFLMGLSVVVKQKPTTQQFSDNEMVIGYLLCVTDDFQTFPGPRETLICEEHSDINKVITYLHDHYNIHYPSKEEIINRLNDLKNNPRSLLEDQLLCG